jgi:hypothetical protein
VENCTTLLVGTEDFRLVLVEVEVDNGIDIVDGVLLLSLEVVNELVLGIYVDILPMLVLENEVVLEEV